MRTQNLNELDASLLKDFNFTESTYFQLRFETFNIDESPDLRRADGQQRNQFHFRPDPEPVEQSARHSTRSAICLVVSGLVCWLATLVQLRSASGQDTRTVTEPVLRPVCAVVQAQLRGTLANQDEREKGYGANSTSHRRVCGR